MTVRVAERDPAAKFDVTFCDGTVRREGLAEMAVWDRMHMARIGINKTWLEISTAVHVSFTFVTEY